MKDKLPDKLINYSQLTLLLSFIGFTLCLLITYLWEQYFSLNQQILAHIFTIIFAAIFKVAVVLLMAASKEKAVNKFALNKEGLCYSPKF